MSVVSIKLKNIKKHKNLHLQMNGKNVAFVGDTRKGKTTILQILQASLGIIDYPKDALTIGETEAESEVVYVDDVTGKQYTIKRRVSKGKLQRFDIRTPEFSRALNWEEEVRSIFNGVDPKVSYFDYGKFFFKEKTADGRFEYAMKCTLGDLYITNFKRIEDLEEERATFGKKKTLLESRLVGSELMEGGHVTENYERLKKVYEVEATTEKAIADRDLLLETRPKVKELLDKLNVVKEHNEKCRQQQQQLLDITEKSIPNTVAEIQQLEASRNVLLQFFDGDFMSKNNILEWYPFYQGKTLLDDRPEGLHPLAKEMFGKAEAFYTAFNNMADAIEELKADLKALEEEATRIDLTLIADPIRAEEESTLQAEYDNAGTKTEEIEKAVQLAYDEAVQKVDLFNRKRDLFILQKKDYDELQETQVSWIEKDNAIKDIELENIQAFKKAIPFPGLEIRDIIAKKKIRATGEEIEVVRHHLYYNGLELNYENISKGESIQIAVHFQAVHSPRLKLIFIPEAQSLGSDFDELAAAADEYGFQWIAEFTERGKEFEMKFEEEIIK